MVITEKKKSMKVTKRPIAKYHPDLRRHLLPSQGQGGDMALDVTQRQRYIWKQVENEYENQFENSWY